jgi:hypothetical protein
MLFFSEFKKQILTYLRFLDDYYIGPIIFILKAIHYFKKFKIYLDFFQDILWIVRFLKHFSCDYMKKGEYFQEMKILHTISLCYLQICFLHLAHQFMNNSSLHYYY